MIAVWLEIVSSFIQHWHAWIVDPRSDYARQKGVSRLLLRLQGRRWRRGKRGWQASRCKLFCNKELSKRRMDCHYAYVSFHLSSPYSIAFTTLLFLGLIYTHIHSQGSVSVKCGPRLRRTCRLRSADVSIKKNWALLYAVFNRMWSCIFWCISVGRNITFRP